MSKSAQKSELLHRFIVATFAVLMVFSAAYATTIYAIAPFVEVETSTTIGTFEPLPENQDLILDTRPLAIANIDISVSCPKNLVFYLGGYPKASQTMTQENYYFVWLPTNQSLCFWVLYK